LHIALRLALAMPYQWALSCFGLLYSGRFVFVQLFWQIQFNAFFSETLTQGFVCLVPVLNHIDS
jgi:hypothetical protein